MTAWVGRRTLLQLGAAFAGSSLTTLGPASFAYAADAGGDEGLQIADDDRFELDDEDDALEARDRSVAEPYSRPTPGSDFVTGGAVIGVNAPMAEVKLVLLAFGNYHTILPRIDQSRIVGRREGTTDLYLRAPVLRGLAHVSGITRFAPAFPYAGLGWQLDGVLVKGNIDAWRGTWKIFPCGPRRTLLRLELFIDVALPVPTSLVNREIVWACVQGVTAVRKVSECAASRRLG
ncbi:MAG: hypothetical protein EXR75_12865 [Myxococcales bacterium]|nr:hypothetical protein [Myxococcales bacterium]